MTQDDLVRSDDELLALARGGAEAGFEGLYRKHAARVGTLARRYVGDPQLAEDVTQDVFLQVFRALGEFRGESEFTTWLYRVTVNTALNKVRAMRIRKAAPLEEAPEPGRNVDPDEVLKRQDLQRQIQSALDALDEDQRAILLLRAEAGLSYGRIAQITGQNEDQVRGKLYRARKTFLQHFR